MRCTARTISAMTPICTPRKTAASSGCSKVELLVQPGDPEHEQQSRQHEAEPGEQSAEPPALHHPEVDAELVRLGPGKHLVDGEQPVEARRRDPLLFLDQLALDHRDLRDRPAPGEQAEAQEAEEDALAVFSAQRVRQFDASDARSPSARS